MIVSHTVWYLFPHITLSMPAAGDVRNDVYITMESGQFEKGSKRAERNVEVAVSVIDKDARPIPASSLMRKVLVSKFHFCLAKLKATVDL